MKRIFPLWLLCLGFSLSFAAAARADQCAYVTKDQAIAAFQRLSMDQTIFELCELCGETVSRPFKIQSLALSNTPSPGLWQIVVNGKPLDLAYTYVAYQDNRQQRVNLALLSDCPASGFTPILSEQQ
ncbi:hypothetical protein [Lyngbya confervoides]|uniref:Uncharacterized protein n=1 Tax=Lyngbya confervoides BDU141951 TaxID=1574623 RepID=A0ABD4T3B0_9CYAN|nr:hypothetical protein [Lyngbya confervoides]MCM1983222.1 hypothetical protein [Lyngbya confervoides BDU141951]